MINMRLLIASGAKDKFVYLEELSAALINMGIQCKLVRDIDYARGFPSKKISDWFYSDKQFRKLIDEFKPDAILIERCTHFGLFAIKSKIPVFLYMRGDYWKESKAAKETLYKDKPIMRLVIWFRDRIAEKCFSNATAILPISHYLEIEIKNRYPKNSTYILREGVDHSIWYDVKTSSLKHPCVGILQNANVWLKTKELLVLPKIIEALPNVTFYWAGDGVYRDRVLPHLQKYDNFKWLGSLEYPDKVREFLSEIDIYALMSGMDTLGVTVLEAMLMKKPVIATSVGGVPELIDDQKTGFLIDEGDSQKWIKTIIWLFSNYDQAKKIGDSANKFVKENYSWEKMAQDLLKTISQHTRNNTP